MMIQNENDLVKAMLKENNAFQLAASRGERALKTSLLNEFCTLNALNQVMAKLVEGSQSQFIIRLKASYKAIGNEGLENAVGVTSTNTIKWFKQLKKFELVEKQGGKSRVTKEKPDSTPSMVKGADDTLETNGLESVTENERLQAIIDGLTTKIESQDLLLQAKENKNKMLETALSLVENELVDVKAACDLADKRRNKIDELYTALAMKYNEKVKTVKI